MVWSSRLPSSISLRVTCGVVYSIPTNSGDFTVCLLQSHSFEPNCTSRGLGAKEIEGVTSQGYTLLAVNEILSFTLPIVVVLPFRFWTDPLGWETGAQCLGMILLICLEYCGYLDIYRILRKKDVEDNRETEY